MQIENTFSACRYIWNHFLERRTKAYERRGESLSAFDCIKILTHIKTYNPWLYECGHKALCFSIKDLDYAMQSFFRRCKEGGNPGYPKYKSRKDSTQGFSTEGTIRIDDTHVSVPRIGRIRYRNSRPVDGTAVKATICRKSSGKYYISICCKLDTNHLARTDSSIGIDFGIKDFAVDSNRHHYKNPKYLYSSIDRIAKEQRRLSRMVKGSSNWNKQRRKIAAIYERVKNQRSTHHHQLSRKFINENQVIAIEDLNIKGMVRNRKLSKAISDASWGEFVRQLEYKASWAGRTMVKIPMFYPSSQMCFNCKYVNRDVKSLAVRRWECPLCGTTHDRDENAAMNILIKGLEILQVS